LTKFIKFNDRDIFRDYQPKGYNYTYVPYSNYKIDFGVAFINWDALIGYLNVLPTSKSNPFELSVSSTDQISCNLNDSITYVEDNFYYPDLSDNPRYANITFISSKMPSRKTNNFGLTYFNFYFSPCFKYCATCSSPAYNKCITCLDPNSILNNGECNCSPNFQRDEEHPLNPCVLISKFTIISEGLVQSSLSKTLTVLTNNIEFSSLFCSNSKPIIGGKTNKFFISNTYQIQDEFNQNVYIDLIMYPQDISFYKVKVSLEIVTEEDLFLSFPFNIFVNDESEIIDFKVKQIKYFKYSNEDLKSKYNCFDDTQDTKKLKHYNLVFYITTNKKIFYLKIKNSFNNFWGILNLNYDIYKCHNNCGECLGYTQFDCISCNSGFVENLMTYDENRMTSSCICDEFNGFIMISDNYSPKLVCQQGKKYPINHFYINDLNSENFDPTIWNTNSGQMNFKNDIQICEYTNVLGNYNPQKYSYYERKIELIKKLPNFDYFQVDFSFNLYFFKKIANFIVKVYLDNNYIWGNTYKIADIEETIICNKNTSFYKKFLNLTYFNNEYFKSSLNKEKPTLKIQVISDSECSFNSECGWGINDLKIKINRANIYENNTCNYRPFIDCPCGSLSSQCKCFPGYYSLKASWGEYNCIGKIF